jgi:hypothetical protein
MLNGCGIVYSLTAPAAPGDKWYETILYSFTGVNDRGYPLPGLVIGTNGALYGVFGAD